MDWLITLAGVLVFGLAGCKSGNFREDFAPEIQKDCVETVSCTTHSSSFDNDSVSKCVTRIGDDVGSASVAVQQEFIDTVSRCQEQFGCSYTACAFQNVVSGYSAAHLMQITYDCQQKTACRMESKQTVATTAVADCVSQQSATLDANTALQSEFDLKWTHCSSYAGCSWGSCQ